MSEWDNIAHGCTAENACNFNVSANVDDGRWGLGWASIVMSVMAQVMIDYECSYNDSIDSAYGYAFPR